MPANPFGTLQEVTDRVGQRFDPSAFPCRRKPPCRGLVVCISFTQILPILWRCFGVRVAKARLLPTPVRRLGPRLATNLKCFAFGRECDWKKCTSSLEQFES